jgi:hypothetical protein
VQYSFLTKMFVQYFLTVFKDNQIESVQLIAVRQKKNSTYIQTKKTQKLFMKSIDKFFPNFLYHAYNHHEKDAVPHNNQYSYQLNNL